jgi:hypothetical protein
MIVMGGVLIIEYYAPSFYYRLLILVLYLLNFIFWLSGWAWCAAITAYWASLIYTVDGYVASLAAAAALGAVNWYDYPRLLWGLSGLTSPGSLSSS